LGGEAAEFEPLTEDTSLRILHVVHQLPPESLGGTERHVLALAEAQRGRHDVAIFTRWRAETLRLAGDAPPVHGFSATGGTSFLERTDFAQAETAFGRVLALRPDVVHVHHLAGLSAGILGMAADAGARVVLTIHDHALACPRGQRIRLDLDPCPVLDRDRCVRCVRPAWIEAARSPDRLRALLGLFKPGEERRLFEVRDAHLHKNLDRVSAFIAPSRSAAELFVEFHPAARPRMHVIPHGLPREERPAPPPVRGPQDPFVVGYFGAVIPSKGVGLLAEVARALRGERIRIVINGSGPESLVRRLVARGRGALEDAGPYQPEDLGERMRRVHAVAVPSLWPETFSIVVREAWQHGRPVLASATGALPEAAAGDPDRLWLLPPGEVGAWTDAVERLAKDAALFASLAGPHEPESFEAMLSGIEACYISAS
jgi:glycosyltransferase involved in cell wall biosynthesis